MIRLNALISFTITLVSLLKSCLAINTVGVDYQFGAAYRSPDNVTAECASFVDETVLLENVGAVLETAAADAIGKHPNVNPVPTTGTGSWSGPFIPSGLRRRKLFLRQQRHLLPVCTSLQCLLCGMRADPVYVCDVGYGCDYNQCYERRTEAIVVNKKNENDNQEERSLTSCPTDCALGNTNENCATCLQGDAINFCNAAIVNEASQTKYGYDPVTDTHSPCSLALASGYCDFLVMTT